MPCFMTGSAEGDAALARDEAAAETTKVTRLLCALLKELPPTHPAIDRVPGLKRWRDKHQKIDAKPRRS